MKKIYFILFLLMGTAFSLSAQRNCGAMEHLEQQLQEDPGMLERMERIEEFTERFAGQQTGRNVISIPVVVHIVYNSSTENLSAAQIQTQIDVLNEDFRRTNNDADNTWSQAADTEIEFCLATIDPDGNATDGITRTATSKRSFRTNDDIKKSNKGGKDGWPSSDYLNIWVGDISNGILGYAQFPGGPAATDGVVIDYLYFGTIGTATAPFDLGRTGTHEVGHWLNLRHIWGDGGCSVDDFVGDTPTSDGPNYGCAEGHVSCSTVDMVQNYMDYSDDACMNLFTQGQSDRMNALFLPGGARESLLSSPACGGTPPPPPPATCDDGVQNGNETGVDCGGPDCPACPTGNCEAPTNLTYASAQGGKAADLAWSDVSAAIDYTLEIREVGATWQSFTVATNSVRITGLTRNVSYEWRVTANCSNGSETSVIASFVAGQNRLAANSADFTVYPNPAQDRLFVQFADLSNTTVDLKSGSVVEANGDAIAIIMDVNGRQVYRVPVTDTSDELELDVNNLVSGLYFLQLQDANGQVLGSTKFVVE